MWWLSLHVWFFKVVAITLGNNDMKLRDFRGFYDFFFFGGGGWMSSLSAICTYVIHSIHSGYHGRRNQSKGHFTHETESPCPLHFKHSHWWKRRMPIQVCFTLRLRDQWSMWMQDGCKVYMDSYIASNGSCLMVTWIIFKNHFLKVGPTQNWETIALSILTTVDLFYFYHVWGPAWIEIHWNSIWLRAQSHMDSHYIWWSMTTLHDFGGVLGWPLDTFFWALTVSWSRLLYHVWSGPNLSTAIDRNGTKTFVATSGAM